MAVAFPAVRILLLLGTTAVGMACLLLLAPQTEANHYRGGTLWLERDTGDGVNPPGPLDVRLHARIHVHDWGWAAVGAAAPLGLFAPVCFGDGVCIADWIPRVVAVDALHEVVVVEAWGTDLEPGIKHRFDRAGAWTYWYGTSRADPEPPRLECCRLPHGPTPGSPVCQVAPVEILRCPYYHHNNPSTPIRLEGVAQVPVFGTQSHKDNMPPVVECHNWGATFPVCTIPVTPTSGQPTLRFATGDEAAPGSPFYAPGPCPMPEPECTVEQSTICGLAVCWPMAWYPLATNHPGTNYYSVALQIESGTERSPLEFLIELVLTQPAHPPCGTENYGEQQDPDAYGRWLQRCVPPLVPAFAADRGATCGQDVVQFTDKTYVPDGLSIVRWLWEFGDGGLATEPDPLHDYADEGGAFDVRLTVQDNYGREFSVGRALQVRAEAADGPCEAGQQVQDRPRGRDGPRDGVDPEIGGQGSDGDGIPDRDDVCPTVDDPGQGDLDEDGRGDACDPDQDGDGLDDAVDRCPRVPDPLQHDGDLDGAGDACDPAVDGDLGCCGRPDARPTPASPSGPLRRDPLPLLVDGGAPSSLAQVVPAGVAAGVLLAAAMVLVARRQA